MARDHQHKAQAEESLWLCWFIVFFCCFYCMIFVFSPALRNTFPTLMAWYSLFVLKVLEDLDVSLATNCSIFVIIQNTFRMQEFLTESLPFQDRPILWILHDQWPWQRSVISEQPPRAGCGVVRIDPLRFLTGCRTRQLLYILAYFIVLLFIRAPAYVLLIFVGMLDRNSWRTSVRRCQVLPTPESGTTAAP